VLELSFGVVLLNWNGFADTQAALDSLLAATPRPEYVVVVDNGSRDDSLARLRGWATDHGVTSVSIDAGTPASIDQLPWLLIIDAKTNRGFAVGNNLGLEYLAKHTQATHFLLLNNDATVVPDYFARLRDAIAQRPDIGLLGSAIYHEPERTKVWYAGGYEIPSRALVLHAYDVPASDRLVPTTFVTGCAMLIARPLFDRLGGLNACYTPIYWEDTDYSRQAVDAGFGVAWAPAAKVYHKVGSSVGGEHITPQVAYWQNRHRGYYVRRNYKGTDRIAALAYLCITKPGRSLAELLRGRSAMGKAIFRGFAHGVFGHIP
jgi:GT2 family glycosyltransferase